MGAVVLSNVNVDITNSQFVNNSAILNINSGDGGGVYFSCPTAIDCQMTVSDSIFVNNSASHHGGGIAWTDYKPTLTNVSFSGNSALYGTDIASYAIKLAPAALITLYELSKVPSGQVAPEPISVSLLDHYGQVVATDNSSIAQLQPISSNTSVSGITRVVAVTGNFVFSAYQITKSPGESTTIAIQTNGIDLSKPQNNDTISASLLILVQMRNCTVGESLISNMCYLCPSGFYSFDPSKPCQNCPKGAICLGNFTMVPMSGYWRSQATSTTFWQCPNSDSCLGSFTDPKNISLTGECAHGYFGNMCNGCISGFSRSSTSNCSICPDNIVNIIRVIGVVLLAALIIVFIIKMSLISAHKTQSQLSIYLKIFLNYVQLITITSTFNLTWPSYTRDMFEYQQNAGNISEQVFSFDCFLDNGKDDNQQNVVFRKVTIVACIPVMIIIISSCFWLTVASFRRSWKYMKNQFINSIVVLFFIAHLSLVSLMLDVLNCRELDSGEYWMNSYLNIRCWEADHMRHAMIVTLPSIILWGIFTPAIAFIVIKRNRTSLEHLNTRIRFGFLYTGYETSRYYWEFVILSRKLLLVTLAAFLTNVSIPVQALCVMLVIVGCLLLQTKEKPYTTPQMNALELRTILVIGVTIYCGLFYLNVALSRNTQEVLFTMIVCANVYFLAYWLLQVCRVSSQTCSKCLSKLAHFTCCYKPKASIVSPNTVLANVSGTHVDNEIQGPASSVTLRQYAFRGDEIEEPFRRIPTDFRVTATNKNLVASSSQQDST